MSGAAPRLLVVGREDGAHIAGSLLRAARQTGLEAHLMDVSAALGKGFLQRLTWRMDRRPLHLSRFSEQTLDAARLARAEVMIATGAAPILPETLHRLRANGVTCINYSTDDPWNRRQGAHWHRTALPHFDLIFTPRRGNLDQLRRNGCRDVRYLPFGYDPGLFGPTEADEKTTRSDVLFVGGADRDRVAFVQAFVRHGASVSLVGGYWNRTPALRPCWLGQKTPEVIRALTAAAKVNLCLVRRANRDGHVMRSFEIPAVGGCMLVEDTAEHRAIFGPDEAAVVYFRSAQEAAGKARALVADPERRRRLAVAAHQRIHAGGHTYADRLRTMLSAAAEMHHAVDADAGFGRA